MTEPTMSLPPTAHANTFPWPTVLLISTTAAAVLLSRLAPLPWPGLDDTPAHALGLGFGIAGIVLIALSVRALAKGETTVRPDKTSAALVTGGPYAWLRNPIYLGLVLVLFGVAEITKSIWFVVAAFVFAVLITALRILPEERHLEARFGDAYLAYRSRTRRWI